MSIIQKLAKTAYQIGFIERRFLSLPSDERYQKILWMDYAGYNKGWFADPFFYKVSENEIQLFVEEFVYSKNKGRLCRIVIDRKGNKMTLKSVHPILELDTHLSFPIILNYKNQEYVYPENWESGRLTIYKYNKAEDKLDNPRVLIDAPLMDSVILQSEEGFYIFGTPNLTNSQNDAMRVDIYFSKDLFGNYNKVQTIENLRKEERSAGNFITTTEGRLIRPVQCCQSSYGKSLVFYNIIKEGNTFKEEKIGRIEPDYSKPNSRALHTFNIHDELCVIDGKDIVNKKLAKLYHLFK